ncbi:hypothetical protein MTO96_013361 [Rhipicephalus appendiculatus]
MQPDRKSEHTFGWFSHHVQRKRQAQKEEPEVEVQYVGLMVLPRIVEPASRETSPYPLPEYLQRLGTHLTRVVRLSPYPVSADHLAGPTHRVRTGAEIQTRYPDGFIVAAAH